MERAAIALSILALAHTAHAQEPEHAPSETPTHAPASELDEPTQAPPPRNVPTVAATAREPLARTTGPRVRFGTVAGIAAGDAQSTSGGERFTMLSVILHARIGAQIDDIVAVVYQASIFVGIPMGGRGIFFSTVLNGFFMHQSAALLEITIVDRVQLAAGPSLFVGELNGLSFGPGIAGRIAYAFGGIGTGTRQGLTIGAQAQYGWLLSQEGSSFWCIGPAVGWETF